MKKVKGVTPIIAILVILLITIAIAGSAYIYISTYYSGMLRQGLEFVDAPQCTKTGVQIEVKNIGTDEITFADDLVVTSVKLGSGFCEGTATEYHDCTVPVLSYKPDKIGPGETGVITDANATTAGNATVQYQLIIGGKRLEVFTNC